MSWLVSKDKIKVADLKGILGTNILNLADVIVIDSSETKYAS